MDIKKRIQELSLDQKAKLYFMGLVRQGKIDRLPDDPKAAYVDMMMGKMDTIQKISPKVDRSSLEKLAGMEDDEMETRYDYDDPIFEAKFKEGDTVIPNMGPHKGVKHKIIYDFGDGKYNIQPIGLKSSEIQYRLGAAGASEDQLKMADNVNESKVDISYTDPGFKFYKMKVDGKRLDREEGTKYLKDLGIVDDEGKDMEIPGNYNQSILDDIVKALKEKGIDADHDAAMDVS